VHNLIDFSLFEPGPEMAFAFVAGCVLGVRTPSVAGRHKRTAVAAVAMAVCVVLWLFAGGFVWAPVATADDAANDAGIALRTGRPNEAVRMFDQAREHMPLNAEYAFRAAQAAGSAGGAVYQPAIVDLIGIAIRRNPMQPAYYLARARYLLNGPEAKEKREQVRADFRRALALNPNEVSIRLEYADALKSFDTPADKAEAVKQYEEALRYNGLLNADEPKRLKGERVEQIRRTIDSLK
jgi:uncharacterized protein (TIGR02996 family)